MHAGRKMMMLYVWASGLVCVSAPSLVARSGYYIESIIEKEELFSVCA